MLKLLSTLFAAIVAMFAVGNANAETDPRLHSNGQAWGIYQDQAADMRLPNVLMIGDSILNGYQGSVKAQLKGKATVDVWVTGICESDPTLPAQLRKVLARKSYDLVHFNIGLHGWPKGRIKDGEYEPLMRNYVKILKEGAPNAKLIWASSTPITVKGKPRELDPENNPTIVARNAAAANIMAENGVLVNDLYTLSAKNLKFAAGDKFHWTGPGTAMHGNAVATSILANLPKPTAPKLTLTSPHDYQVIQRRSRAEGIIPLVGTIAIPCDKLELRLEGKDMNGTALPASWTAVTVNADLSFKTELKTPAGGWYTLTVRAMKAGKEVASATVSHVGVGEVFVGAGQSNSTNCGGLGSKLPTDGRTNCQSGMVSSFNGSAWRIANDPQWGTHDFQTYQLGSFWPAFGDAMYAKFKVPVGVAVTGHGGTAISAWKKGSGLYQWTLTRMNQLGKNGFRAVLWHQGESDYGSTADLYAAGLGKIIADIRADAGWEMPWFVAHASFCPNKPVLETNSRGGQKTLWDNGIALEGPDTDKMVGDLRDNGGKGIHFSKKGLKAHGEAWAEKVTPWLEKQLSPTIQ